MKNKREKSDPFHSSADVGEQTWATRGGVGGAKERDRGRATHVPDTEPGKRVPGARTCRGLRSNGTENRLKGVEWSHVKNDQKTQFSPQRGYRGGAQSPNQSNLRACVPSRKIFPMSSLRSQSLLSRFSVPLLPKPRLSTSVQSFGS